MSPPPTPPPTRAVTRVGRGPQAGTATGDTVGAPVGDVHAGDDVHRRDDGAGRQYRLPWDLAAQLVYLTRVIKAPTIAAVWADLGDQARAEGWSHEEYLATVLARQVAAREANGTAIRTAGAHFPAVKTLEDFNLDHQPSLRRDVLAHRASTTVTSPRGFRSSCSRCCGQGVQFQHPRSGGVRDGAQVAGIRAVDAQPSLTCLTGHRDPQAGLAQVDQKDPR